MAGARACARRPHARPPGREEDDRGGARWAGPHRWVASWAGQVSGPGRCSLSLSFLNCFLFSIIL